MTSAVSIPYKAGLSLAALIDAPDDVDAAPCVILLHGFTGWKEEEHISSLAEELCARGIVAIRFDAPGSGESDGTFADDYRLTNYIESVGSVLEYARAGLHIDPHRIALWGHSMGGFAALEYAVNHGDDLRAVCACQTSIGKSGVSETDAEKWKTTGWASFAHMHFRKLDLPYEFYLDRQQYDIRKNVGDLDVPLMLIAGTRDNLAPARVVRSIYDAAPEPKQYMEFNVDHFYKKSQRLLAEINVATVAFFERFV